MAVESSNPVSSVEKACLLMRVLSDHQQGRLTDIAAAAGLDKATALRLLGALEKSGFVTRDPTTKRYGIGRELLVLGAAAMARFDPRHVVRPSLLRLTEQFEDTAIFSIPSGAESLCIDVAFGRFPIQVRNLEVGSRRPMGVGPSGLAMLATMGDSEREAVLEIVHRALPRYPRMSRSKLQAALRETQQRGHAVLLDAVVERMGAVATAIQAPDGRLLGTLSVSALSDRIVSRQARIAKVLQAETMLCAQQWMLQAPLPM